MGNPILLAKNIEKTVHSDHLFETRVSRLLWRVEKLEVESSGLYVIAGKNGAGKSTLLRCLLGLLKPDKGDVAWFGKGGPNATLVGYLPEFPIIPPSALVKDWLSWLLDIKPREIERLDSEVARYPTLSVLHLLNIPANRLSKGQQQRVQLWAAMAKDPAALVLDEPFSGLDPWARVELGDLLVSLLNDGRTIFISTHELVNALRARTNQTWLIQNETVELHPGCALPS
jgi:ABC-2 type transport system ATP-binding protein